MAVIMSDPLVRERATMSARPSLASMALKESRIKIRNMFVCVVGPSKVAIIKIARSARVSRARRAGRMRVRWRRNVNKVVRIIKG